MNDIKNSFQEHSRDASVDSVFFTKQQDSADSHIHKNAASATSAYADKKTAPHIAYGAGLSTAILKIAVHEETNLM